MPGAADWQSLPNSVTDSIQNQNDAQQWASDQQVRLAQDWADQQRSVPAPAAPPLDSTQSPPTRDDWSTQGQTPTSYVVQQGDTLSSIGQKLGVPYTQLAQANGLANPNLIYPGQRINAGSGTTSPVGPGAATAAQTPVGSGSGQIPDWLSKVIADNSPDDLKNDPEFQKIVAAGAKAESQWNPQAVQQGGGGRGLFQFDVKGGMGKGLTTDQLFDPNYQASKIMPMYAAAYKDGQAKGLTGAELASYVAANAEHPMGYDNPNSAARQNYRDAYNSISPSDQARDTTGANYPGAAPAPATTIPGTDQPLPQASDFGGNVLPAAATQGVAQAPTTGPASVENQRQFETEAGLSTADAYTACGPVAAVAFAQTYGRNPTAQEAIQLAKDVGWTPGQGMAGVSSEQALLSKIGVQTKLETNVNWNNVQNDVSGGNPVIVSTPNHYFYVSQYDPSTGKYFVGNSGTVLRTGATWMSSGEIAKAGGGISGALYVDQPNATGPSVAETTQPPDTGSNPIGAAASAVAQKAGQVKDAVANAIVGPSAASQSTPLQNLGSQVSSLGQNISNGNVPNLPLLPSAVQPVAGAAIQAAGGVMQSPPIDQQSPDKMVLASLGAGGGGSDETAQLATQFDQYSPQIKAAIQKQADTLAASGTSIDEIGTRIRTWMKANPPDTVNNATAGKVGVDTTPGASQPAPTPVSAQPGETASQPAPQPTPAAPTAASEPLPPAPSTPPIGPPAVQFDQEGNQITPPAATPPQQPPAPPTEPPMGEPPSPSEPPPSNQPSLGQVISAAPAEAKKAIFSLTNVHASNIARGLLTGPTGPQGSAKFVGRYISALIRGPRDVVNDPAFADQVAQATRDGVNFFGGQNPDTGGAAPGTNPILTIAGRVVGGAVTGGATGAAYSAQSKDNQMLRDILVGGAIGAVAGPTAAARMHDALWQDAVPAAKLMTYQAAVDGGADGAQAAMFANNLNGGQNLSSIAGSKPMTELMRWTLQSPDWLISQAKLAGAGVLGTAKTLIPGQTPTGNEVLSRDWLVKTVLTYGFVTEALQYALTGHFTDQNSPGNRFQIEVPSGTPAANGKSQNLTVSIFPGNLQQILDAADRAQGLGPQGLGTTAWDKTNPIPRTAIEDWGNFQYPGGPPIAAKNSTPNQAAAARAGFTAEQFGSIGATSPTGESQAGMNPDLVALLEGLGIPMSHNTRAIPVPKKNTATR